MTKPAARGGQRNGKMQQPWLGRYVTCMWWCGALRPVWRWRHRAPTTCSRDPSLLVEIEGKFQVGSLVFGTNPRTLPTVSSTNPLYINIHFGGIGVGRAGGAKNSRSCFLRLCSISFAQRCSDFGHDLYHSSTGRPLTFFGI